MRWAHVGLVVALTVGACSSGDGGSENVETSAQTATTTSSTEGDAIDSGPILSVVSAHDVDEHGAAVDPALEFASDVALISMVALVGEVELGAPLEVAWTWLDGPDGEQPLFEHQIDVSTGDIAYSHGIASGPLAAGRYRASLSVGGSTTEMLFAVRPEPITFPSLASGFVRRAPSAEPAPPSSGPSGTIPAPREDTTGAACQPWVQANSMLAMTGADRCGDNEFEVTAWVGDGPPRGYGRWIGDFIKPVRADPCDLGGSDLATEPISYAVAVIAGPEVGKLFRKAGPPPGSDTDAPMAFLSSQPLPGAQVSAGDTIIIEITADDGVSVDSIVTGIASVTLATGTGQQVDGWEFEGPVACDKARLRRVVRFEYLVPENAPELVTLVATILDYEGHETTLEASYPTVGLWTGYMDVVGTTRTEITIDHGPVQCTTGWEFKVVFFAPPSGELYGYAEGIPQAPHQCDAPFAPVDLPVINVDITGTMERDRVILRFGYKSGDWYGINLLYRPPVPEITLTRSRTLAYGEVDVSVTTAVPNNTLTETLKGRIDVGCDKCDL